MKTFFIRSILLSFLVGALASLSFGSGTNPLGGAIVTSPGGEDSCIINIKLPIYITNLDLFLPVEDDNGTEYFPVEYSPVFIRYSINGTSYPIVQLNTFYFYQQINGINVYKTEVNSESFDICDQCGSGGNPIEIYYKIELLREHPSLPDNYIPYPACDFSGENDIFSCRVFDAAGFCGNEECSNKGLTKLESSVTFECEPSEPDPASKTRKEIKGNEKRGENISIQPNPFQDVFTIKWSEVSSIEGITLLDTNGNLIKSWNQNLLKELTNVHVNTSDLSKGLYFIKIKSKETSKVMKIIKQ